MESKQIAPETADKILKDTFPEWNNYFSEHGVKMMVKAMQEYADQEKRKEALAFARWLHGNSYMITPKDEWRLAETFERHATEEIYDLYLLSLTQNKEL